MNTRIESPAAKYVAHVWEGLEYADYVTLLQKSPNDKVKAHEIYAEYKKKISAKNDAKLYESILNIEAEKLLYFILAYPQKVVIVKSGEKDVEKRFLGYEFSNRRGNEGIHAIQKGKNIDECTKLFDANNYDNPEKASSYVYRAFKGDYTSPIAEGMQSHISRVSLIDMLTFDRPFFEKGINLNSKKKVIFNSSYALKPLDKLATFQSGLWKGEKGNLQVVKVLRNTNFKLNNGFLDYSDVAEIDVETTQLSTRTLQYGDIILEKSGGSETQAIGRVVLFDKNNNETYSYSNFCSRIRVLDTNEINPLYLWIVLHDFYCKGGTIPLQNGIRLLNIDMNGYSKIKIPVPPIDIQKQIVEEIAKVDKSNSDAKFLIDNNISDIRAIINSLVSTASIKEYFDINTKVLNPASCWGNEHFAYVDIDSVGKGDGNISFDKIILGKDAPSRARRVAQDRTVIISTVRPYLKGFAYIENVPNKTIFSTGFALLRSKNEENYISKLLYYLFMFSDDLMKQMETAMPKAAYPSINKEDIYNFKIPLLSIDEQKRIVAQIEVLESEITKARTLTENAASEKQAILDKYL